MLLLRQSFNWLSADGLSDEREANNGAESRHGIGQPRVIMITQPTISRPGETAPLEIFQQAKLFAFAL